VASELIRRAADSVAEAQDGDSISVDVPAFVHEISEALHGLEVIQHPLGFFHIELTPIARRPTGRVRLHLWSQRSMAGRDDLGVVHDHTWDLASAVLVGAIEDTTFSARPADDGPFHVFYHVYADRRLVSSDETVALAEVRRRHVSAGSVYRISAGTPHTTKTESLPTLTLVVGQETGRDRAAIFVSDPHPVSRPSQRRPVDRDVAREELLRAGAWS
jgi:hypothetical protein